jgi:hypothetical protein
MNPGNNAYGARKVACVERWDPRRWHYPATAVPPKARR